MYKCTKIFLRFIQLLLENAVVKLGFIKFNTESAVIMNYPIGVINIFG